MFTALALLCTLLANEPLTTGPVEPVAEGFQFTEGPVWMPSKELLFSDIPANIIYRVDKTEFRNPSGNSNGLTLDPQGRLVACEHGNRRVSRTEKDGTVTTLAERYEGKRLNSPNDACVRSDGTVFFTDPPYGVEAAKRELDFCGVYAIRPDGTLVLLGKDFKSPNGIALSPDEKTLYVADTEGGHVRAFDVAKDGTVSNGREVCQLPSPDGMRTDAKGNLWCTAGDGVRVYDPKGNLLQTVAVPQAPANCTFGGEDGKTLFITARTAVYKVATTTGRP